MTPYKVCDITSLLVLRNMFILFIYFIYFIFFFILESKFPKNKQNHYSCGFSANVRWRSSYKCSWKTAGNDQ